MPVIIVLRSAKGSELTQAEMDQNWTNLKNAVEAVGEIGANNSLLIRDDNGNLQTVTIANNRMVGRTGTGTIRELTAEEIKTLLAIGISDVATLQAALDAKIALADYAAANSIVIKDGTSAKASRTIAEATILGRLTGEDIKALSVAEVKTLLAYTLAQIITPNSGWQDPTGTSTKTTFDTSTVTTAQLAERVKAIYEALRDLGILQVG